jgi:ATP-binding cassette subfamily B protein/subfamily B ATP-binding cassette protein MsbA
LSEHHRAASRRLFEEYRRSHRPSLFRRTPETHDPSQPRAAHRSISALLRELYKLVKGQRATLAGALALLAVATLVRLVPPAATKLVIDYVLLGRPLPPGRPSWLIVPSDPRVRLVALAGAVLLTSAVGLVVHLLSRWRATVLTKRVQVAIRKKVFEHAARLPLHRVYQLRSGGAASLLREDAGGVGDLIFSMLFNPWQAIIQFAGGLVVLAWVDARMLVAGVLLVPGLYWSNLMWVRRIRPLHRDIRRERQDIDAQTTEVFGGMRVVRAFGRQQREAARFVLASHLLARQEIYAWWWSRTVDLLWEILLPVASGALLIYGGLQVLAGRLSPGDLMMFLVYLAMLLEPMAVLATSATQLQSNLAGFDRVLDLLAEPRELDEGGAPGVRTVKKAAVAGRITLNHVSFHYPGSERAVLRDVSLVAEPGEVVALVGASGAGKTTLCNLIARFYDPTAGSVRLDGIDLRDIEVESYRRLLGIVEQDVFLFDGTVTENIGYAVRRATPQQIERAARAAHAHEFIAAFPDGYDTLIGERGVRLSGGQRQRIAIARAVLADPKVFILDEATSNLDTASERLIQRALSALMRQRTSFVIAHRLSTIQEADRILVLDAGAVVETGTHAELMRRGGRYRDMVELQRMEAGA